MFEISAGQAGSGAEKRLLVHALFRLPQLDGVVAGVGKVERRETRSMTAVYHDTEDLRLFRWGVTLRRCEGEPDPGWHLQLPAQVVQPEVSGRVSMALDAGGVGEVPHHLADLVTALVREGEMVPVATLRTERTPYLVIDLDGEPVAELVDDTVSVMDGEHVAARFREMEVAAIGEGRDPVLADLAALLVEHGAVPGEASRAANALGPRASAQPDVVLRGPVCPQDPAADAVRAHIALQVSRFLMQDMRVRLDLPDSVHQMRVAARRLRSGLKVFGPLLDAEWSAGLRGELGWAAGELGRVRDTEVMLARLDLHAEALAPADAQLATEAVERVLNAELAQARQEALESLRSQRHRALLEALVDAVNHPQLTLEANQSCAQVLPPMVSKAFRRLARDVRGLQVEGPAEPWHETRIAGKKARYAAELVAPVFGEPAKRLAKALEGVTEVLGDHQDCHVAEQELRVIAMRDDVDGACGFALGLLHAAEVELEMALRERFGQLWPDVVKVQKKTVLA